MTVRIFVGDVRARLAQMADESVHCIWTSPPYFGLRSYGTEPQVWSADGGACEHEWADASWRPNRWGERDDDRAGAKQRTNSGSLGFRGAIRDQSICGRCGAWRGEHGLEPTLDLWLDHEVLIWRALRRVLRRDGVAWLNIGDAYSGSWGAQSRGGPPSDKSTLKGNGHIGGGPKIKGLSAVQIAAAPHGTHTGSASRTGLAPKQRMMMPARLALRLQDDGWWIRDEIVWHKPNPMPSSVEDRTTPAHEMLYLLTKSARYFWDAEAVREPSTGNAHARVKMPDGWDTGPGAHGTIHREGREKGKVTRPKLAEPGSGVRANASFEEATCGEVPSTRNLRSVWTITSEPFGEAHFAVAPTALVEPCIKAGTSERGVCSSCLAPWVRETERVDQGWDGSTYGERAVAASGGAKSGGTARSTLGSNNGKLTGKTETTGWSPSCKCNAGIVQATVLDPFSGAATTLMVADRLGRDAIGIELNPAYVEIARRRLEKDGGMFAKVEISEGVPAPASAEPAAE